MLMLLLLPESPDDIPSLSPILPLPSLPLLVPLLLLLLLPLLLPAASAVRALLLRLARCSADAAAPPDAAAGCCAVAGTCCCRLGLAGGCMPLATVLGSVVEAEAWS